MVRFGCLPSMRGSGQVFAIFGMATGGPLLQIGLLLIRVGRLFSPLMCPTESSEWSKSLPEHNYKLAQMSRR